MKLYYTYKEGGEWCPFETGNTLERIRKELDQELFKYLWRKKNQTLVVKGMLDLPVFHSILTSDGLRWDAVGRKWNISITNEEYQNHYEFLEQWFPNGTPDPDTEAYNKFQEEFKHLRTQSL